MSPRRPGALPDDDTDGVRRYLLECCSRVLLRRRTADITVREIAAEARVATGLLYNHFEDKDDLVIAAILERGPAFEGAALSGRAGTRSVAENLTEYARESLGVMRDVLPLVMTLKPAILTRLTTRIHASGSPLEAARQGVAAYLLEEQRLGRISQEADVETSAMVLTGALHELALFGTPGADDSDDAALVDRVVATVMRGLT
jgi:AcrR family transcriptional regulator